MHILLLSCELKEYKSLFQERTRSVLNLEYLFSFSYCSFIPWFFLIALSSFTSFFPQSDSFIYG